MIWHDKILQKLYKLHHQVSLKIKYIICFQVKYQCWEKSLGQVWLTFWVVGLTPKKNEYTFISQIDSVSHFESIWLIFGQGEERFEMFVNLTEWTLKLLKRNILRNLSLMMKLTTCRNHNRYHGYISYKIQIFTIILTNCIVYIYIYIFY